MNIESARDLKAELRAGGGLVAAATRSAAPAPVLDRPIAVGVAVLGPHRYGLAVRYRLGTPGVRALVRRVVGSVGDGSEVDVRRTGRLRPLLAPAGRQVQVVGERGRVRPVRPGLSVGHPAVTAGTLGGFVTVGGAVHVLSNSHVLADSGRATEGDPALQPGPADGGTDGDRIGVLAAAVPLLPGPDGPDDGGPGPNRADAALARLDADLAAAVDPAYPAGRLTGTAPAQGEETVEKIGRTTGVTRGIVTAIEVDDVVVDYGPGLGPVRFEGQVEVSGVGGGSGAAGGRGVPFSRGGDSGSLVYEPSTRRALGLLFAGSETGGDNGAGLTYCNAVDDVLTLLGAELLL